MAKPLSKLDLMIEQQDAVGLYLNALLAEEAEVLIETDSISDLNETHKNPISEDQLDNNVDDSTQVAEILESADLRSKRKIPEQLANGFQALNFAVSKIQLCVPLQQLKGIIESNQKIICLPGQAIWCFGVLPNRGKNICVIDTSRILNISTRSLDSQEAWQKQSKFYILLIGDGTCGLACDSVDTINLLTKNDINWRNSGANEFVMGAEIKHMKLILNVEEIMRRFVNGTL